MLTLCEVLHNVEQDPKDLFKSSISDHSPVCISILHRTPFERGEGPIGPEITRHPFHHHYFLALCWEKKFVGLRFELDLDQFQFLKNLMRASAGFD